ncbi:MAG TPA: SpoIIE family protein phosphatase [Gemmataceae bacterium]|nr:SpoIIE family protein phosphatase [Gemmataceae bacterium]
MASLRVLKGPNQGAVIPLNRDKITLGRNPDCDVVIPVTSVSREHAQIIRLQDRFYIIDLQSRNGTFVNNQPVSGRTPLHPNDQIRICDFLAAFQDSVLPPLPPELVRPAAESEADDEQPHIEAALTTSKHLLLETQPAEKIRALLEISSNLSKTLQLDPLLPKICDSLFQMFRQADRCFIILAGDTPTKLIPKVIKTRRPGDESNARFSRSIVKRCLESGQAFLSDDASAGVPLSQSVVDFRIRSVMCVPLTSAEGKPFGVIQLDTQDRIKKFTEDDLKLLWGVANQASIALENARLHEEMVEQARVKQGLLLAHQVQRSFLPQRLPEVPAYEFFAHYEPAQEVGGDYYDFIPLPSRRLAVTLGDVAGKGMPAALLMAKLSSEARFCLLTEPDPAAAMSRLNDQIYQHTSQMDRFVTLAAAVLDPDRHAVTLVSAGHPAPLLYHRETGTLEEAISRDGAGMPLGIVEGQAYLQPDLRLAPGDCLLLFTDGVTDAVNVRKESFGIEGITAALRDGGPFSPQALVERVVKAVKQHAAGCPQHDDITLVCLGRVP